MNFHALPNWVLMFQNSIGGSCTMSLTLHDLNFHSCLIFYMQVVSVVLNTNNPASGLPFKVSFSWLFILEVDSVS